MENSKNTFVETLWKSEKFFFALFVFITAYPFLFNAYFPTVDGPAHLHNGNLLKHYLFKDAGNIPAFYELNKNISSNYFDHLWFAISGLFLPPFLVEKSIILFYIIGLPYSFRFLVKKISGNEKSAQLSSYLIFSFVYTFPLQLGFFNFCSGIPILFLTLGVWIGERNRLKAKTLIFLTTLTTIVYATHLFNFILLGIAISIYEIQFIIHAKKTNSPKIKLWKPLFVFLPGLALTGLFFISNNEFKHDPPIFLTKEKLTQTLIDIGPLITLQYEKEVFFTHIIAGVLILLLGLVIYKNYSTRKNKKSEFRPRWIYLALLILILFYSFPDWVVSGGYISIRLAQFFFLILIILIASKEIEPRFLLLPVSALLTIHTYLVLYHNEQIEPLSEDAAALVEAGNKIEPGAVLLPLNYSKNWLHVFHANYLATEKNVINLDNYEPTQPHFPFINKKQSVFKLMDKYGNRNPPCINIDNYEKVTHQRIDYLSRFYFNGDLKDSCSALVEKEIQARFELIHESKSRKVQLYKRKPNT
jgi:hypothetical protein